MSDMYSYNQPYNNQQSTSLRKRIFIAAVALLVVIIGLAVIAFSSGGGQEESVRRGEVEVQQTTTISSVIEAILEGDHETFVSHLHEQSPVDRTSTTEFYEAIQQERSRLRGCSVAQQSGASYATEEDKHLAVIELVCSDASYSIILQQEVSGDWKYIMMVENDEAEDE